MHLYALGHHILSRLLGSGGEPWWLKLLRGSHLHIEHLNQQQLFRTDAVAKALLMPLLECRHQRRRLHLLVERQHQGLLGTGIAQLQRQPNHRLSLETLRSIPLIRQLLQRLLRELLNLLLQRRKQLIGKLRSKMNL